MNDRDASKAFEKQMQDSGFRVLDLDALLQWNSSLDDLIPPLLAHAEKYEEITLRCMNYSDAPQLDALVVLIEASTRLQVLNLQGFSVEAPFELGPAIQGKHVLRYLSLNIDKDAIGHLCQSIKGLRLLETIDLTTDSRFKDNEAIMMADAIQSLPSIQILTFPTTYLTIAGISAFLNTPVFNSILFQYLHSRSTATQDLSVLLLLEVIRGNQQRTHQNEVLAIESLPIGFTTQSR